MDEKEAILIIEDVTWNGGTRHYGKIPIARDLAVKSLEKQMPKRVKMNNDIKPFCPVCGCMLTLRPNYFGVCGQKLDWGLGED